MTLDYSFLISLALLFSVTLLGGWLRARRKDRCLKDFEAFHVTLERKNNKVVWGVLELAPNGLELNYRDSVQDKEHIESSYILYKDEFSQIQSIYRYADQLSTENKVKRSKDIQRSFNPNLFRLLARRVNNFIITASESLNEVFGLLVGRARRPASHLISEQGEGYIKKLGSDLIGNAGTAHDPLMEQHIGDKVVIEIIEEGEIHEHVGIFKNYSAHFLEILDVQFPQRQSITLEPNKAGVGRGITAIFEGDTLKVENHVQQPVLVQSLN